MLRKMRTITGILVLTTSTLVMAATSSVQETSVDNSLDEVMTTLDIRSQLVMAQGLEATAIHVSTDNGVVTLSGDVDSTHKREQAIRIATLADNVNQVVTQLNVSTR